MGEQEGPGGVASELRRGSLQAQDYLDKLAAVAERGLWKEA